LLPLELLLRSSSLRWRSSSYSAPESPIP
jgi:hypothetical protein